VSVQPEMVGRWLGVAIALGCLGLGDAKLIAASSRGDRAVSAISLTPARQFQVAFDAAIAIGTQAGTNARRYQAGYYPKPGQPSKYAAGKESLAGYRAGYYYGFQVGYYGTSQTASARQFYRGASMGSLAGLQDAEKALKAKRGYNPQPLAVVGASRQYQAGYDQGYYQSYHNRYYNLSAARLNL